MIAKDISFQTPTENILFDDALLDLAEHDDGGEVLRFWESPQTFIVLGRTSKPSEDVCLEKVKQDNISVLRRSSGGGTVVQGKGCLNFSLILSKEIHPEVAMLKKSYRFVLGKVINALGHFDIKADFRPISDLALSKSDKKFSGNAQKRGRKFILHHGTILYDFDLTLIERYLKIPKEIPEYRRGRPHLDFVANLPAGSQALKKVIADAFAVTAQENVLSPKEQERLNYFLQTRNVVIDLN